MTIVQDEYRAHVLLTDNRVKSTMRTVRLPVSFCGPSCSSPSRWLQEGLSLDLNQVLILFYGAIDEHMRFSVGLAHLAQNFPDAWHLVFHGYGSQETIAKIRQIDRQKKVCLSLRLVPARQQQKVVCSAKIGLALYGTRFGDLCGLSSEKIAFYLQCGLPVIAFRRPSYEHIEAEECGILVDHLDDVPEAIQKILEEYDRYAQNAFSCYNRYYRFEKNFESVLIGLKNFQTLCSK